MRDIYKRYLNNVKDCDYDNRCTSQILRIQHINGTGDNTEILSWGSSLILQDGTFVNFGIYRGCESNQSVDKKPACAYLHIDVNGVKGPNKWGRDAFRFILTEDGLYPTGCAWTEDCRTGNGGQACTCKVLQEGAMNY